MNSPWLTAYRHFSCHAHVLTFFLFYFPERGKLADPFYRLEHGEKDMQKKKEAEPVLVRLQRVSDSRHSDDYALNKALRAQLRASHCGYDNLSLVPIHEHHHPLRCVWIKDFD